MSDEFLYKISDVPAFRPFKETIPTIYFMDRLTPEDLETIKRRRPGDQILPIDFELPTDDPDC